MTEPAEMKIDPWIGKELIRPVDIEEAWKEFDVRREGERLVCKTKDGKIMEIIGGQNSPLYPLVLYSEWKNFGADDEEAVEGKMSVVDFLALKPMIIDTDEI